MLFDLDDSGDDYSEEEYIDDVNSDKTKSINESLPEEISKSKAIEETFRSKGKSDDYENDFEEEPISD